MYNESVRGGRKGGTFLTLKHSLIMTTIVCNEPLSALHTRGKTPQPQKKEKRSIQPQPPLMAWIDPENNPVKTTQPQIEES
jgi:hypothetical protein